MRVIGLLVAVVAWLAIWWFVWLLDDEEQPWEMPSAEECEEGSDERQ